VSGSLCSQSPQLFLIAVDVDLQTEPLVRTLGFAPETVGETVGVVRRILVLLDEHGGHVGRSGDVPLLEQPGPDFLPDPVALLPGGGELRLGRRRPALQQQVQVSLPTVDRVAQFRRPLVVVSERRDELAELRTVRHDLLGGGHRTLVGVVGQRVPTAQRVQVVGEARDVEAPGGERVRNRTISSL
jgi:hypothetical protein